MGALDQVTKVTEGVTANVKKSPSTQLAFGASEEEKGRYMSRVRSNRFSVNSALSEYEAAKKRSELYGGSGSTANALKNAEERLRDMGLTEQEVGEWSGASPRNRAAVASKLEMKRTAMRSNESFTPENMRYEKGSWVTDEPAKPQAAKPASQFRGFVSETHRQQMSGVGRQPVKINFALPAEDTGPGEDVGFFDNFSSLLKDSSSVTRTGEGEYLVSSEALKALRESGSLDPKQFSDEFIGDGYGARMRVTKQGRGYSAEFSPITSSQVVEGTQQSMVDSAYGQFAKRMVMEADLHNRALSGGAGPEFSTGKAFAIKRLNQHFKGSGFSFDEGSSELVYSKDTEKREYIDPKKKGEKFLKTVGPGTADSYSKELESMRDSINAYLSEDQSRRPGNLPMVDGGDDTIGPSGPRAEAVRKSRATLKRFDTMQDGVLHDTLPAVLPGPAAKPGDGGSDYDPGEAPKEYVPGHLQGLDQYGGADWLNFRKDEAFASISRGSAGEQRVPRYLKKKDQFGGPDWLNYGKNNPTKASP